MSVFVLLAALAPLPPLAPPDRDDELLQRYRAGAPDAFAAIYRQHAPAAYRRLTRILGPIGEREDLMQDVFLSVHRALPRFRGDATLATLVQRIAINVACDHLRRQHRRPAVALPDSFFDAILAPGLSPEETASVRGELRRGFACLARIKPKKRVALLLRLVDGLSLEEIGKLVDASPETVAKRIEHAQRELEVLLSRERGVR